MSEDITDYDPAVRQAMEIGVQAGLKKDKLSDIYTEVLLGNHDLHDFVNAIESAVSKKEPELLPLFDGVHTFIEQMDAAHSVAETSNRPLPRPLSLE